MASKTKKVILFIAEGPTDEDTLSPVLKGIFQKEEVRFHIVHGDMTSDWSVNGKNAVKTVNAHIEMELKRYGLTKKDILKVIHLVDTDGAFIPKQQVFSSETGEIRYFEDHIETGSPETIAKRNEQKSQVLHRLCQTGKVGAVPYGIYYFSRNLEHVLHNISGPLSDREKADFADRFADQFRLERQEFIRLLSGSDFTVPGEFRDTWEFISQGINSLGRHSNFHLAFEGE